MPFVVEHSIVCAHALDFGKVFFKVYHGFPPTRQGDFTARQLFKVERALPRIIGGGEYRGHGENFRDKVGFPAVDGAFRVNDSPTEVVDEGLGDGDFLFLRGGVFRRARKGRGFAVKHKVVFAAVVKFFHFLFPFCP